MYEKKLPCVTDRRMNTKRTLHYQKNLRAFKIMFKRKKKRIQYNFFNYTESCTLIICTAYMYLCMYVSVGEGNGNPLQYSCLENPMAGGAWQAAVHGVAQSRTQLSDFSFPFHFHDWRRKWQPTPVFLPGEPQGQRSLVGCPLWGRTESDTTDATQQQQQQWWTGSEWSRSVTMLNNRKKTNNFAPVIMNKTLTVIQV